MEQQLRILLVDDNPHDRELAARTIYREFPHADITHITTAAEFEQAFVEQNFDLVVTDYQFRWSDGITLLHRIKAQNPDCPVIMFTATGTQETAVEAMKAGLDDYVIKSARHIARLAIAIHTALERAAQRRRTVELESERGALLEQAQAAQKRALFLADASAVLATSLDYHVTLAHVAELVVAELADWCFIDMIGRDGQVRRLATAHRNPAQSDLADKLQRFPPNNLTQHSRINAVLQTGETLLISSPQEDLAVSIAQNGEHEQLIHSLAPQSMIVVALRARDQILGAITLISATELRQYNQDDQRLVEEVARRAALAIDNARLYTSEQHERRRAERAAERTAQLQTLTAALVPLTRVSEIARVLVDQSAATLGAFGGAFMTPSRGRQALDMIYSTGFSPETIEHYKQIPLDIASTVTEATREQNVFIIPSWQEWITRYPHMANLPGGESWETIVAVPLLIEQIVVGVFVLCFDEPHNFDADDRQMLLTLSRQSALAMARAQLYESEQQSRAAAEAAVRIRDQFLSVASHELRTPLTSLLGNAQLVQRRASRDGSLSENIQRGLQVVVNQARQLSRMIESLLDVSRLQTGQLILNQAPVDLVDLTQRVAEEARPLLDRHVLRCELPDQPVVVVGDDLRLQQVLYNLVSNAIKYSPSQAEVLIRITQVDETASIIVVDQGIGIPAESLPHLFQRFYRASNVDPQHISGMGIGLYVVKEIVTLHGGEITVESAENTGSTFTVRLPLAKT